MVDLNVTLGGGEDTSTQLLEEKQEVSDVQIGITDTTPITMTTTQEEVVDDPAAPTSSENVTTITGDGTGTGTGTGTVTISTEENVADNTTATEDTSNLVITLLGLNVDVTMGIKAETLAFPSVSEIYNLPVGAIKVSALDFRRAFQFKPSLGTGPTDMETSGMKFRFNRNSRYPNSVMTTLTKNNPMKAIFPKNSEIFSDVGNVVFPQLTANQGEDTTEQPRVPYEYGENENTIPHDYVKCVAHQCFGSPANYVTFENLSTLYGTLESNSIGPMNEVWANCKSPAAGIPGLDSSTGI